MPIVVGHSFCSPEVSVVLGGEGVFVSSWVCWVVGSGVGVLSTVNLLVFVAYGFATLELRLAYGLLGPAAGDLSTTKRLVAGAYGLFGLLWGALSFLAKSIVLCL